jgi:hypothetical protein
MTVVSGLCHLSAISEISWYRFERSSRRVPQVRMFERIFKLKTERVIRVVSSEYLDRTNGRTIPLLL